MLYSGVAAKGTWESTRLQTVVSIASSAARRNDYSGTTLRAPHIFDTTVHLAIQSAGSPTHCNAQTCRSACAEVMSNEDQLQAKHPAEFATALALATVLVTALFTTWIGPHRGPRVHHWSAYKSSTRQSPRLQASVSLDLSGNTSCV